MSKTDKVFVSLCYKPFNTFLLLQSRKKGFWFLSFECNCITFESIYGIGPFFNSTHITFFQLWSLVFNGCLSLTQFRHCMFYLLITFIWYTFLSGPISNAHSNRYTCCFALQFYILCLMHLYLDLLRESNLISIKSNVQNIIMLRNLK